MAKKPIKAFIDADFLVYAAGFAAEHKFYLLTTSDEEPVPLSPEFKSKEDLNDWQKANDQLPDFAVWERLEVEPVENALHSVKISLGTIEERIERKFNRPVEMLVYLTGSGNFREKVATIKPYKGNRDPRHHPALKREIRRYLIDVWGAEVIHDREADDEVCILQTLEGNDEHSIIVGLDKDLWQCPGWHYNTNKDAFANISRTQGDLLLFRQMLTGDATDNIMGCYRVGEKAAKEVITPKMTRAAMWNAVVEQFAQNMDKYPEKYPDDMFDEEGKPDAYSAAFETAELIYMLRAYDGYWRAPA